MTHILADGEFEHMYPSVSYPGVSKISVNW